MTATPSTLTKSASLPRYRWTTQQYHAAVRAGFLGDGRLELLDGDIVTVPVPDPIHEAAIRRLLRYLISVLGQRAHLEKVMPIALSENSEPIPDIAVVKLSENDYATSHPTPQETYLLIEIANSNPERDIKAKRLIYAQAGILEYWVFDLDAREMRVFRAPKGEAGTADYGIDTVWNTDTVSLLAFPDIELSATTLKQLAFN
ncbi:MAG: Uma2 family endonuclease [Cyanobacteria bacterium P01_A01_bin.123]